MELEFSQQRSDIIVVYKYCRSGNFMSKIFHVLYFCVYFRHWAYRQKVNTLQRIKNVALLLQLPQKKTMLLQMHHANWHAYQFQMAERACTCKDHTSSRTLSSLLHLLITSVIALAGIAENSIPLGYGRSPTNDAAGPSVYMWRSEIKPLFLSFNYENFHILNSRCFWEVMKIFLRMKVSQSMVWSIYVSTTLAGCRHILMIPSDFSTHTNNHSVLLVMMFNAQDVTKQPKNNKPEFLIGVHSKWFTAGYLALYRWRLRCCWVSCIRTLLSPFLRTTSWFQPPEPLYNPRIMCHVLLNFADNSWSERYLSSHLFITLLSTELLIMVQQVFLYYLSSNDKNLLLCSDRCTFTLSCINLYF